MLYSAGAEVIVFELPGRPVRGAFCKTMRHIRIHSPDDLDRQFGLTPIRAGYRPNPRNLPADAPDVIFVRHLPINTQLPGLL